MIKKFTDCPLEDYKGVACRTLINGKEILGRITYFKKLDKLHPHDHDCEQVGYVISGKLKVLSDEGEFIIEKGDSYAFPRNSSHGFEALEDSEVIDMFTA
ncbi:cupin domain-containing protein [bacterium]|jgi:quercetin dioxygenase-like cupin family protein|nr:cupin domain-containing protein [bacterium]